MISQRVGEADVLGIASSLRAVTYYDVFVRLDYSVCRELYDVFGLTRVLRQVT